MRLEAGGSRFERVNPSAGLRAVHGVVPGYWPLTPGYWELGTRLGPKPNAPPREGWRVSFWAAGI